MTKTGSVRRLLERRGWSAWLLVAGFAGHGCKGPVAAPQPLCCQHSLVAAVLPVIDWVAAAIFVVLIADGVDFHH